MNLFAIIIGLLIDLYYTETRALRYYGWFARLSGWSGITSTKTNCWTARWEYCW